MFCPVGYHTASSLWREFQEQRLPSIYSSAVKGYNSPDFIAAFSRGSPLDICEHIFLKSLAEVGVHLASPQGTSMRVYVNLDDGVPSIFSTASMYASARFMAAASVDSKDLNGTEFLEDREFKSCGFQAHENKALASIYPLSAALEERAKRYTGWQLYHHTLHHHIHRRTYIISKTVPSWAIGTSLALDVAPLLEHFAGWSICVDDDTYNEKWQDYLTGRETIYPSSFDVNSISSGGRPRLDAAYAAFKEMGFDKGTLSWEQLGLKIERETGEKPVAKTLRNWRDANNEKEIKDR